MTAPLLRALVASLVVLAGCRGTPPGGDAPRGQSSGRARFGRRFAHGTAEVNGTRLRYVRGGVGSPVVLLHGWPQTRFAFGGMVAHACARTHRDEARRLVVTEAGAPGFGLERLFDTSAPGSGSCHHACRMVPELPERLVEGRELPKLRVPVLALGGETGVATLPAEQPRRVAEDGTTEVVPGVGHRVVEQRPDEVARRVERFLAG